MHLASSKVNPLEERYLRGVGNARLKSLGFIFMRLRISRSVSRARAALLCGASDRYLREFESGSRLASVKVCLALGQEFGVNPEWVKGQWLRESLSIHEGRLKQLLGLTW